MNIYFTSRKGRAWALLAVIATVWKASAASGPTLWLGHDQNGVSTNPVASFMYFVPLISPEPVTISASADAKQSVRLGAATWHVTENSFAASCTIEFTGPGLQETLFDLSREIHRHDRELRDGGTLSHQLKSIVVHGSGVGRIEIEGTISNGVRTVDTVRLLFNGDGEGSPVTIDMCDIRFVDGDFRPTSEIVARVSTLTFRRATGVPKMEVTVASVKDKDASDSMWQNFKGRIKGFAANLLIDPFPIETDGHQAMLDFGRALITGSSSFTFPQAQNLQLAHGH